MNWEPENGGVQPAGLLQMNSPDSGRNQRYLCNEDDEHQCVSDATIYQKTTMPISGASKP